MTPRSRGRSAVTRWALPALGVGVLLAGVALLRPATAPAPEAAAPAAPVAARAGPVPAAAAPAAAVAPAAAASAVLAAAGAASGARSAGGVFESDAGGRLVLDARTRQALESLVALNPAEAVPGLVEAEVQGLPPAAAAAARELAQRFEEYQAAQRAAFPPGEAPLVPQQGLAELDAVVALRSSYFGAEAARRLFGADEAVTRRLLQLMAQDQASTLTMEQKATRAQQRFDVERGAAPAPPSGR